jgi:tetratricopeptide (TPR) repeat protein
MARGFLGHPALHVLLVLAVALIAYSNSFDIQFQFDDKANITENPLIKRVLKMNPKFTNAYINHGVIYNSEGRPDKAAEYLKQAVALRPDITEAHNNLAIAYRQKGFYGKAQEHSQIAEELKLRAKTR